MTPTKKEKGSHEAELNQAASGGIEIESTDQAFPIVAVGASAGGLEAFQQFLRDIPESTGMAFILIQHLDPNHPSQLAGLLQKRSHMPVIEAGDNSPIQPDRVYVIPPHKNMIVVNRTLQLIDQPTAEGPSHNIDIFFRSLAEDQKERAICVVLSGTGTDGTLGIRAVKAELGLAIAQDPATAAFDGMPNSAVDTGIVDFVLPPAEMYPKLTEYVREYYGRAIARKPEKSSRLPVAIQSIIIQLRSRFNVDFSEYKKILLHRRVQRRMAIVGIEEVDAYLRYFQESSEEQSQVYKDFLIGVTSFFRDPEAFESLKAIVKPIIKNKPSGGTFRVWVPACSSGEEAYSVSIILRECIEEEGKQIRVQIFATDVDYDAIRQARTGYYRPNISIDVSRDRLETFFTAKDNSLVVTKDIRDPIIWSHHNALKDPPFTRMDMVSCRNLLIYLEMKAQYKLLSIFHYSLNPKGVLFLGSSESVGDLRSQFEVVDRRWKIYEKQSIAVPRWASTELPVTVQPFAFDDKEDQSTANEENGTRKSSIARAAERQLTEKYVPPAVVVNEKKEVVFIHGDISRYLIPSPGVPSWDVLDMAREGLAEVISMGIETVQQQGTMVSYPNVRFKLDNEARFVDLTMNYLEDSRVPLILIVFDNEVGEGRTKEKGKYSRISRSQLSALERELKVTKNELQRVLDDAQTYNEELQSTNEELQTSQEELQTVNEELMTTNAELQARNDLTTRVSDDLKNLLDSIDVPVVFLDSQLRIKSFTPGATKVFDLYETDTGRFISHVTSKLPEVGLVDKANEVLETLAPIEMEVATNDGNWYSMRILPYRTAENAVSGIVLTFDDIGFQKELHRTLDNALAYAKDITDIVSCPFIVLDGDFKAVIANPAFCKAFGTTASNLAGVSLFSLTEAMIDSIELRNLLDGVSRGDGGKIVSKKIAKKDRNGTAVSEVTVTVERTVDINGKTNHYLVAIV